MDTLFDYKVMVYLHATSVDGHLVFDLIIAALEGFDANDNTNINTNTSTNANVNAKTKTSTNANINMKGTQNNKDNVNANKNKKILMKVPLAYTGILGTK